MAEQPKYFDIEDVETNKRYRIQTNDASATYDEAVEYFSALPEQEWAAYEYRPQTAAPVDTPTAPATTGEVTLSPGVEAQPRRVTQAFTTPTKYDIAANQIMTPPEEVRVLSPEAEQQAVSLINDPNVPLQQVDEYLVSQGRLPAAPEVLAEWQKIRDSGVAANRVQYQNPFEGMENQEYIKALEDNSDDSVFGEFTRSLLSAWADPATGQGMIGRGINDFLDTGIEELRERFPNANPDELEELQERYVAYLNRKVFEARERGVAEDSFIPWLAGQFLALDPVDAIPFARAPRAASRAGRVLEKTGEAAGVAGIADVGYQAAAINAGAQDEFDPVRTAFTAGLSGAFGGAAQGIGEAVAGVAARRQGAEGSPEAGTIVMPTGKKNTKAYRTQLGEAQDQVLAKVTDITSGWTNRPQITVHQNFDKLPGVDKNAIGMFTQDGQILINTEAVINRAKERDVSPESVVEAVTFHESLGHYGLTQLFREDLDAFLDDIYVNGSEEFRATVDKWLKNNPGAYANYEPDSRRILGTEEVLAGWSEKGPLPRTFVDNVLNLIKDFGRQMGVKLNINKLKDIKYTTREVRAYLAVANDRVVSGTRNEATPSVPRNMTTDGPVFVPESKAKNYAFETGKPVTVEGLHGTSAEFEDFDPLSLGTLTKTESAKQAFWFATREKTARTYAAWSSRERWFGNERKPPRIIKRAIQLTNPLVVDMKSKIYREESFASIVTRAKEKGHDGVILRNAYDSGEVSKLDAILQGNFKGENLIAVFDPKNILRESPETGNKYMRGDGPIDPDQLSADDLIEAQNALDVLNRIDYTPTVIPVDQLEAEIVGRGINPSDVTRLVGMNPGTLVKRLFQYDLAATKIGERVATITADIEANGLTDANMIAYVKATTAFNDILDKLFDLQGEFGRSLAATRRANYTRKRVTNLKEVLKEYNLETLSDPETFMRYMAEMQAQMNAKKGDRTLTYGDKLISAVNIPRAIMSSADLSAPLRQGVVFISYPEYWGSFAKMFTMLGSSGERNYKFLMEKIATHPNYELMQKARLAFSSLDGELSAREEDFQTEWARKIPVFGKVVKASEQAYAGFLNKLRADMFNRFVADYQKAGVELDDETLKGLGRFINAGTGRAELPEFLRPSSAIINATFFSGRLMYSRVQMLNPQFYAQLPSPVRKEAARAMLGFAGIAGLVAGSVNALWPDDVETELDPRSSDFMKLKVGNTRFDIGGGFNQYLVLGARTASWMYNNSLAFTDRQLGTDFSEYQIANKITAGGDERKYGTEQYAQETLGGAIAQFFRTKLSPQMSYFIDMINEQDVIGREFTVEGSLASRLVPMTASSVYDAYKEDSPVPMPVIFTTTIFGVGVNSYTVPGMDPDKELKAPVTFEMQDLDDGQNDLIRAEGGVVTLKPAAKKKWQETLNTYYPFFIEEVSAEMGMSFEEMDDDMKKATVKEATKRARYNAKEDMMYELGLAE